MRKREHRGGDAHPVAKEFRHSSQHADLESLLAEHMIDPEALADWLPSRRGNSAGRPRPTPDSEAE